ncbi:uncharacterized protein LOC122813575 [Protopterus annectens]|uniref:uncharacterized protein LOC122813575 n=1 Tax=Protopterus annectens TaxID=7888 RepID=UPI001CF9E2D8|nr:uncharacterized protein LOC122813575 [Protopterus annectens]
MTQGVAHLGSKVTITCTSNYKITDCELHKTSVPTSAVFPGTQYVIKSATAQDEGFYTCQCHVYITQYPSAEISHPLNFVLYRYQEKPQIRMLPSGVIHTGSKVMIECSNSLSRLKECWFYQHDEWRTHYSNSSTELGIQYVIESATTWNEGSYSCECNNVHDQSTQRSKPGTLAIKRYITTNKPTTGYISTNKPTTEYITTNKPTMEYFTTEKLITENFTTCKTTTGYDYTLSNIIRLCLSLIVLLLMVIFTIESTCEQK